MVLLLIHLAITTGRVVKIASIILVAITITARCPGIIVPPLMKDTVLKLFLTVPIPEMIHVAEDMTVNVGIFPNLLVAALLVIRIEEEGVFRHPLNGSHQPLKPLQRLAL